MTDIISFMVCSTDLIDLLLKLLLIACILQHDRSKLFENRKLSLFIDDNKDDIGRIKERKVENKKKIEVLLYHLKIVIFFIVIE